ncbi:tRNA 2-thiocytidine biosynthesis protein TtcA [candidate division KSB1 bacterium]|nr:tRNA 2-thiocytidine biosynthesis protein TtcA [candidate division KSB1 bacterium]
MFAAGDRLLLCVSGGADSMSLLYLLSKRYTIYAADLQLTVLYVDMGFGNHADKRCEIMQQYLDRLAVRGKIIKSSIGPYAHSEENRENPCFLCTRIRRKKILETAEELGCNKIVFGHHKDDVVETLLINMIFGREISTMIPYLPIHSGKFVIVRPLVFTEEILLKQFRNQFDIPVFEQECPSEGNSKRRYVKELLTRIESDYRGSRDNIFNSMKKVKSDYLL